MGKNKNRLELNVRSLGWGMVHVRGGGAKKVKIGAKGKQVIISTKSSNLT